MKKTLSKTVPLTFLIALISFGPIQAQTTAPADQEAPAVTKQAAPAAPASRAKQTPARQGTAAVPARQAPKPALAIDPSLNGQYQDLLRRSWSQQTYKVINPERLNALWRNVQDSLRAERNEYGSLQTKINSQAQEITALKQQVQTAAVNLEKSEASVNDVQLLGMSVNKSAYSTIMWGTVLALALALSIVIFTAGKSIREAKYRKQLFDEVSAEYQTYKVKANEKEKKLARELQTERNRIEELLDKNKQQ